MPTDSRIVLRQLPERTEAVATFTWALSEANIRTHLVQLLANLADDEKTLKDTQATFEVKKVAFEGNQKVRGEELKAIAKAIEIISSQAVSFVPPTSFLKF